MKKYYTSLNLEDGKFVGTVFESVSNNMVYKTKPYTSQTQVVQDINTYLATSAPPVTEPQTQPVQHQTIINTVDRLPATGTTRRCCGR
jgi:hypothetical protein